MTGNRLLYLVQGIRDPLWGFRTHVRNHLPPERKNTMASVVLQQACIMLILIGFGAACFRLKILSEQSVSQLSSLVLKVVNPIVILMSFQRACDPHLIADLGWTFLLAVISYAIAFAGAYLCIRDKAGRDTVIERFSAVYSNCGFMGIPLVQAMFGYEGVFYLTAFIAVFNAFVWSHGVMQMSGQRSLKSLLRVLRSPAIIAIAVGLVMFFTGLTLPEAGSAAAKDASVLMRVLHTIGALLAEAFGMVGSLNTPLAMFVAGATIIRTDIPAVLKKPRIFYVSFLRLIAFPMVTLLVFLLFPVDAIVEMTVLAAASAPCAAICTMMSLTYKRNASYASEIFGVSTLLSVATMPLMMVIYETLGK